MKIKSGHKKQIAQLKSNASKIGEECLHLYGLVEKTTQKVERIKSVTLQNQNTKIFKYKQQMLRLNTMEKVPDFEKLKEFTFFKVGLEEFEQQNKSVDSESGRLENLVETLKDPNDTCECSQMFFKSRRSQMFFKIRASLQLY